MHSTHTHCYSPFHSHKNAGRWLEGNFTAVAGFLCYEENAIWYKTLA